MTYYDHGTSLALQVGEWRDNHTNQPVKQHSWVHEKELAEHNTEKRLRSSFAAIVVGVWSPMFKANCARAPLNNKA